MRRTVFLLLTLALLTVPVCAVQLPGELLDALPEEAAALAEGEGITEGGVWLLVQSFFDALRASLDRSLRGAVLLALTVLLNGSRGRLCVLARRERLPLCTARRRAVRDDALGGRPFLAHRTGNGDHAGSRRPHQAPAADDGGGARGLRRRVHGERLAGRARSLPAERAHNAHPRAAAPAGLLPHRSCLGGAALPESGLDKLADGLKKLISWLLCGAVTAFTLYLSVSGVSTGSADRAAVKAAQTAVSGAVPGGREHSRGVRRDGAQRGPFAARGHRGGRRAGRAARPASRRLCG